MTRAREHEEVVLGVDFGTAFSVVAVCQDGVDAEVLDNDIGCSTTPTCVHLDSDGLVHPDRHVGEAAVRLAVSEPASTVRNVKRILGLTLAAIKADPSNPLGNVEVVSGSPKGGEDRAAIQIGSMEGGVDPEEIASMVLMELRYAAENRFMRPVKKAVLAVPGYFNAAQRNAVLDAASLAGLEVVRLVNETSAAALAFAHARKGPKHVAVVDVGGGGGCVSVVQVEDNGVRVLATSGVRLPGGEDFDRVMVEHLKQLIKDAHGKDVTNPRSEELLRSHWEKAKRKLMSLPYAKIATFLPGDVDVDLHLQVKRAEFEDRCEPLFQRIAQQLRETMREAEMAAEQVDDVVLVGGSTRISRLRTLIQEAVGGRPLCKAVNPDEAVAKGAALLGAGLVDLRDVTPLQLDVLGHGSYAHIARNTALPAEGRLQPARDAIMVRQGCLDAPDGPDGLDGDRALATIFEATRATPLPQHAQAFRVDESGLFHFLDGKGDTIANLCLRGCLPTDARASLQSSTEQRVEAGVAALQKAEAKNSLEEKCRALLSTEIEVADGHPDAAHVGALRRECEAQLQWLYEQRDADREVYVERLQGLDFMRVELGESRRERELAAAAKKALATKCAAVLNLLEEVGDDHPDAVLNKKLRQACSGEREMYSERDFKDQLQVVEVLLGDLMRSREEAAAAAARGILERRCIELLNELDRDFQDITGLAEKYRSQLEWLDSTPRAAKGDYEFRLRRVEEAVQKEGEARKAAQREAEAQAAAAAAAAARGLLERRCIELLNELDRDFQDITGLADKCRSQLEWLDSTPRATKGDYESRLRRVEEAVQQEGVARKAAQREAEAQTQAQAGATSPPDSKFHPKVRGGANQNRRQREEAAPYGWPKPDEDKQDIERQPRPGDCDGESDTSPARDSERWDQGGGRAFAAEDSAKDLADAVELVRTRYRGVFNDEVRRRRSSLKQAKNVHSNAVTAAGPVTAWVLQHQDEVLCALARRAAEDAIREARAAGRVALLVDEVVVPGRCVLVALSARYVRGEVDRAPVERLLLLQDAYLTSGADLMRRLDELTAAEGSDWLADAICGVSWEDRVQDHDQHHPDLVGAAGRQLLQLVTLRQHRRRAVHGDAGGEHAAPLRKEGRSGSAEHLLPPADDCGDVVRATATPDLERRRGLGPRRLWGGGHCLARRIADECARQHPEARDFLKALSDLTHVFEGQRFSLLRRRSPSATASSWASVRGAVSVLAKPGGLENVIEALGDLRNLESLSALQLHVVDSVLDRIRSTAFMVCVRIFDALFSAVQDVSQLLAFSGPSDVSVVERCAGRFWLELRARTGSGGGGVRLRFESARRAAKLAETLLTSGRTAVQACVDECAFALWLRHAVATGEDASQLRVPVDDHRAVLADLSQCRGRGVHKTDPRELLAAFGRAHFLNFFPALGEGLVALLTSPLIPCAVPIDVVLPAEDACDVAEVCPDGKYRYRSARLLRDSLLRLCATGCREESLLEPIMTLLSSTGWSAVYDFDKDFYGVLSALVPTYVSIG